MSKKNYTKFSNPQFVVDDTTNGVADIAVESIEPIKPTIGIVTNCPKLNVRKMANKNSDIVCVIDAAVELEIDEQNSTVNFYKVRLADGREGFCMKQFITINL